MDWLAAFAHQAAVSDQLRDHQARPALLATGLYGEAGSVLAEVKKSQREGSAYPGYRQRLTEEFGDVLWYFVRLVSELDPTLLDELPRGDDPPGPQEQRPLQSAIHFALGVADVLRCLDSSSRAEVRATLQKGWNNILGLAAYSGVSLEASAQ